MSKKPFEKFIKNELKGAKKKEAIRQEKRKLKEEARQRGEEFRKKEAEKYQAVGTKYGNTPEQRSGMSVKKTGNRFAPENTAEVTANTSVPIGTGELMPLNKFIAHAGISGRREAADLVKDGKVTVNGDIIYEPGYKVRGNEDIKVNGKRVFSQKNLVYILLNKPKDYLTTLKDPEGRKTVIDLIKHATKERVYPVGRLDRNTTGVLLLTNDGELAQKLTHPSFEIKKIYEVKLDKPVPKKDMDAIVSGLKLEDGFIKADAVSYADAKDKTVVGIEIHSGRNRIVRRIFEHLGYEVRNLDRVMFANLTKKNVDRGKWRFLNEKELRLLKFMNQSFIRAAKDRAEKIDRQVDELLETEEKPAVRKTNTKGSKPSSIEKTDRPARARKYSTAKGKTGHNDRQFGEMKERNRTSGSRTATVQREKPSFAKPKTGDAKAGAKKYTPAKKSGYKTVEKRSGTGRPTIKRAPRK